MINDLKYYCNGDFHPTIGSEEAAGIDLYNNDTQDIVLKAGQRPTLVKTKLYVEIPKGWVGLIYPRSSLGIQGLSISNTTPVIDSDYRGEIMVSIYLNTDVSMNTIVIKPGERYVQMVLIPHYTGVLKEVNSLSETERGTNGIGSTGR